MKILKRSIVIASWHWKWSLTWRWILSYSWKHNINHLGPYWHTTSQGRGLMCGVNMWKFGSISFQSQPNQFVHTDAKIELEGKPKGDSP